MRQAMALGGALLALWACPSWGADAPPEQVPLSATLVTEGTLPATEIEGTFSLTKSATDRTYQLSLSSLQYAFGPSFGIKLVVPFSIVEPRNGSPNAAGFGDVAVMAKYAPIISLEHQFALASGVKVTFPSGSESRGLGGTFALSPFVLAGKAWTWGDTVFSLQADAFYSWQLSKPARVPPGDPDGEPEFPDREQRAVANVTAAVTPLSWLSVLFEVNSSTVIVGAHALEERVQVYATPGLAVQLPDGWNVRAGIQLPLTRTKEFDYSVLFIATKGF
jgi:hypothetical protein